MGDRVQEGVVAHQSLTLFRTVLLAVGHPRRIDRPIRERLWISSVPPGDLGQVGGHGGVEEGWVIGADGDVCSGIQQTTDGMVIPTWDHSGAHIRGGAHFKRGLLGHNPVK